MFKWSNLPGYKILHYVIWSAHYIAYTKFISLIFKMNIEKFMSQYLIVPG